MIMENGSWSIREFFGGIKVTLYVFCAERRERRVRSLVEGVPSQPLGWIKSHNPNTCITTILIPIRISTIPPAISIRLPNFSPSLMPRPQPKPGEQAGHHADHHRRVPDGHADQAQAEADRQGVDADGDREQHQRPAAGWVGFGISPGRASNPERIMRPPTNASRPNATQWS